MAQPGGAVLFDGAIPLQWTSNDGLNAVGRVDLEDADLQVIVATAASGQVRSTIPAGAAAVEIYSLSTDEPLGSGQLSQGETGEVAGLDVTFEREAKYTGILVRQDPGTVWMWIGSALLVVGMSITFVFQYRRIWVRVFPEDGQVAIRFGAVSRWDASYQRLFENIVAEVSDTLSASPGMAQVAPEDSEEQD